METLLALLLWFNLGPWIGPTPGASPAPTASDSTQWATTQEMLPGLPPPKP